jgi:hypothetical protein
MLDKQQYTYLLLALKAITYDQTITITLDKEIQIQETQHNIFALDSEPQKFLYNRFIPKLLGSPCTYLLRTTLKQVHQITNRLAWFNQQRIFLWHLSQNNINWALTLQYISYGEKPLALTTSPSSSAIKNFKIKLLSEELPTYLLLHWRNATKYPNHLCPRCYNASENITHLLTCIRNNLRLTTLISQAVYKASNNLEIPVFEISNFIQAFISTHINKQVPLGFITEDTLAPFKSKKNRYKYASLIHHNIISVNIQRDLACI